MEDKYLYSIIKYKHSAILGEALNVGVIVYFQNSDKIKLRFDDKLIRLKCVYENVPDKIIRHTLKDLNRKIEFFNRECNVFDLNDINNDFKSFIFERFVPRDSSSLFFSEVFTAYQHDLDNEFVLNFLENDYLFKYKSQSVDREYEIGKSFYNRVKDFVREEGKSNRPNFYRDYKVINETGLEYTFKYAWQNGSLNLVKPLNFDLSEQRNIARKAHQNYGLFIDLESVGNLGNHKYDLLIKRPSKRAYFKEYDHSIDLLSKIKAVRIFEEKEISNYTESLKDTIRKQ